MKLKKEDNINNDLFKEYFTNYWSPSDTYEKLLGTKGVMNAHSLHLLSRVIFHTITWTSIIKEVLTKIKKWFKLYPKIIHLKLEQMNR